MSSSYVHWLPISIQIHNCLPALPCWHSSPTPPTLRSHVHQSSALVAGQFLPDSAMAVGQTTPFKCLWFTSWSPLSSQLRVKTWSLCSTAPTLHLLESFVLRGSLCFPNLPAVSSWNPSRAWACKPCFSIWLASCPEFLSRCTTHPRVLSSQFWPSSACLIHHHPISPLTQQRLRAGAKIRALSGVTLSCTLYI